MKKRLTQSEEFEIMKLVLDKFLWLGFIIMGYGMWVMVEEAGDTVARGLAIMVSGAILLLLFLWLIVKEYEVIK